MLLCSAASPICITLSIWICTGGSVYFIFMIKHTHIKRQNRNLEVCRGVPLLYQGMKRDIAGNEEGSNMVGFWSKASITDSCLAFQVLDMWLWMIISLNLIALVSPHSCSEDLPLVAFLFVGDTYDDAGPFLCVAWVRRLEGETVNTECMWKIITRGQYCGIEG